MPFSRLPSSVFQFILVSLLLSSAVTDSYALPTNVDRRSVSAPHADLNGLGIRAQELGKAQAPGSRAKSPIDQKSQTAKARPATGRKSPSNKVQVPAPKDSLKRPAEKEDGAKVANAACPLRKPSKKLGKRSLYRRAVPTVHPSGASATTFFHGSKNKAEADSKAQKVDLSLTHPYGDYHMKAVERGCDGGFYVTDSLFAAAQFICHHGVKQDPPVTTAYVNEYTWIPPPGLKHIAYDAVSAEIEDQAMLSDCKNYDLLEGPMGGEYDEDLHREFWQYAITSQKAIDEGLRYVTQYTIPCSKVDAGKNWPSEKYQEGQRSNPGFAECANRLEGKC